MADIEENAGRKATSKKEIALSGIDRITRFGALVWMQWGIVLDRVSGPLKFHLSKGPEAEDRTL
jgi:hypothetical protein